MNTEKKTRAFTQFQQNDDKVWEVNVNEEHIRTVIDVLPLYQKFYSDFNTAKDYHCKLHKLRKGKVRLSAHLFEQCPFMYDAQKIHTNNNV